MIDWTDDKLSSISLQLFGFLPYHQYHVTVLGVTKLNTQFPVFKIKQENLENFDTLMILIILNEGNN